MILGNYNERNEKIIAPPSKFVGNEVLAEDLEVDQVIASSL